MVLNITPDHLDRHGSFETYAAAKTRITERQAAEDFLVLNAEDKPTQMVAAKTKAQIYWFSGRRPIKQGAFVHGESILFVPQRGREGRACDAGGEIPLKGAHNVENVLAAVCAARLAGIPAESDSRFGGGVQGGGASAGVCEGGEWRGVLQRLEGDECGCDDEGGGFVSGGIHLILGGKDKDSDYTLMSEMLNERVKIVYTIGSAAEKIERQLQGVVKIVSAGDDAGGRCEGGEGCGGRRCGAAGAGLLELRPV